MAGSSGVCFAAQLLPSGKEGSACSSTGRVLELTPRSQFGDSDDFLVEAGAAFDSDVGGPHHRWVPEIQPAAGPVV